GLGVNGVADVFPGGAVDGTGDLDVLEADRVAAPLCSDEQEVNSDQFREEDGEGIQFDIPVLELLTSEQYLRCGGRGVRRDERRRGRAVGCGGRIGLGEGDDGNGSRGESEQTYGQPVTAFAWCLLVGAVGRDSVVRLWHHSAPGGMPTCTNVPLGSSARRRI